MMRKLKIRPEKLSDDRKADAISRLGRHAHVSNSARSIVDDSPLPMATFDGSNHILRYVNPAFCRLSSKTKEELTGRPFAEAVTWEGCVALLNRVQSTGEFEIQTQPEPTEAHPTWRSYLVWPLHATDDRPVGLAMQITENTQFHQRAIAVNEQLLLSGVRQHELRETAERLNAQLQLEIAERKRMEQALVRSEKLAVTARFASTMAHEINNPLAAITNLAYLLAPLQTSPEAQAYIATIEDQLKGLTRIATQALKFNRDSNKAAEFSMAAVLREVSEFYSAQAEKQGIVIHHRIETGGAIVAFRSEIVQVITNLLLNALDATPAGGQVILHLYPAPRWLGEAHGSAGYCISVADTGSGIAPQNRARIYQPFFTTKGEAGTGLGLWVSAGIIDRIGGSIRVWSSSQQGRSGTCFSIFLPGRQTAVHRSVAVTEG
jgi:two-component system NtrC family sensor kinase